MGKSRGKDDGTLLATIALLRGYWRHMAFWEIGVVQLNPCYI